MLESGKPNRVIHCSTAHSRYDIRIFMKECRTLADAGYSVSFVVADGMGNEIRDGVSIYGVKKHTRRFARMVLSPFGVLWKALSVDSTVYHLHDPELLFIGLILVLRGKRVVFDSHEDVPKQILTKPYLEKNMAKIISSIVRMLENVIFKHFSFLVSATDSINDSYKGKNARTAVINNYPFKHELHSSGAANKARQIVYLGSISAIRGVGQLIDAMALCCCDSRLDLAGPVAPASYKGILEGKAGWRFVDYHGVLGREDVKGLLSSASAGVVTFLPAPNHIDSQPNKLFEYMSAGLPVIASSFPLWQEIVIENECGICVDPENPEDIAAAIDWIMEHPDQARAMGQNGRKAILEKYNWETESRKLIGMYDRLMQS